MWCNKNATKMAKGSRWNYPYFWVIKTVLQCTAEFTQWSICAKTSLIYIHHFHHFRYNAMWQDTRPQLIPHYTLVALNIFISLPYIFIQYTVQEGLAVASIARDDPSTLPGDDPFPRAQWTINSSVLAPACTATAMCGKLGSEFET